MVKRVCACACVCGGCGVRESVFMRVCCVVCVCCGECECVCERECVCVWSVVCVCGVCRERVRVRVCGGV